MDLQSKSLDWFLYDNGLRHASFNWAKRTTWFYIIIFTYNKNWIDLSLKRLGCQLEAIPYVFSKNVFPKKTEKREREKESEVLVFSDFSDYHKLHFSRKFCWNSSCGLEGLDGMKIFFFNFNYFRQCFEFLVFPCHKRTNDMTYDRSC